VEVADVGVADVAPGVPSRLHDGAERRAERHQARAQRTDPAPAAPRHVIFSARYRLTLKGPDRGRWEADVVAEADAPLATADAVVRGVRKRTGEAADAERVAPDAFRLLVGQPA
jgi:hypothetical protein